MDMSTSTIGRGMLPTLALLLVTSSAAACGQATPSGGATPATARATAASPESSATSTAPVTPAPGATSVRASATGAGVRLDATLEVGFSEQPVDPGVRRKPGVVVTYTLTRDGAGTGEVVAYDVVPDSLGSAGLPPDVNPEHAWVYADGDTVRVSKQSFAAAPGTSFIAAPTTGVRVIPPSGALEGRAYAGSPPELDVPGAEFAAPRGPLPAAPSPWEFCVQVGERQDGMQPSVIGDGVLEAPVRAPEGDELLCTGPVALAAP
jgi:hypothetical protein